MAARAVALCAELLYERPSPASVARVLREHGESGDLRLGAADVAEMRVAAGRLVEVFAADGPGQAADLLNRLLGQSAKAPRLTSHGGTTSWHVHVDGSDDAPWGEWFLTSSAMSLALLLAEHQRVPGGLCASASCGRPYLDLGGGSPRRYCSARCATRERVAAHRSRTTAPGVS
ncbi:CGNR zinc finger domain-containing protein [Nonomuraea sp. NN258]|nr:CGNR zinc finger domain-containing protein [Nonomuraea antri]